MSPEVATVYLCLGSNMGDRRGNLKLAMDLLTQRLRVGMVSSVYETEPVGGVAQPMFLNMVCQVYTSLAPLELLNLLNGIERKLGRTPGRPNSPRPIDIDILLYDNQVIETAELVVPHPRLAERAFVLIPLAEIAPGLVHPVNGKKVKAMMKAIAEVQGVFKWEEKR